MSQRDQRFAPGVSSVFAELSLAERRDHVRLCRAQSRRAVGTTSSAAFAWRRELSVLPPTRRLPPPSSSSQGRLDRVREERLGGFTSDADVPPQLAPARGLESWRRGLRVLPQAWRPYLPSSVSQIGRDHVLGALSLRRGLSVSPPARRLSPPSSSSQRNGTASWRIALAVSPLMQMYQLS